MKLMQLRRASTRKAGLPIGALDWKASEIARKQDLPTVRTAPVTPRLHTASGACGARRRSGRQRYRLEQLRLLQRIPAYMARRRPAPADRARASRRAVRRVRAVLCP